MKGASCRADRRAIDRLDMDVGAVEHGEAAIPPGEGEEEIGAAEQDRIGALLEKYRGRTPNLHRWGALQAHAAGAADALLIAHAIYRALGRGGEARRKEYRALFRFALDGAFAAALRAATNGGWALGDARFAQRIAGAVGPGAAKLVPGRPCARHQIVLATRGSPVHDTVVEKYRSIRPVVGESVTFPLIQSMFAA